MITAGQRLGRLTALRHIPRRWVCRCDCGECAAFTAASLKHARQCPVCTARDTLHAKTANLLTPEEQQMLFGLSISPEGAYLFTPQGSGPTPPTAVASFNFKTGAYSIGGAPVVVADFLGQDAANWAPWDPAVITPGVGLVGGVNANPVFAGDLLTLALSGATFVMAFEITGASDSVQCLAEMDFPDYVAFNQVKAPSIGQFGTVEISGASTGINLVGSAGAHKIALTLTDTHAAASYDGSAAFAVTGVSPAAPNAAAMSWLANQNLVSFTVYPVQADSDLPALSA